MPAKPVYNRNLWTLTVLCLLRERPMHPYEMRQLIAQRHKGEFLDLKPGSLYHAVQRLLTVHMILIQHISRPSRRPERTVYAITAAGERELLSHLHDLLAAPSADGRGFFAGLSFIAHLTAAAAADALAERAATLRARIEGLTHALDALTPQLGRVLLLENEYARDAFAAELRWVQQVQEDLRAGRLAWSYPSPAVPHTEALS